MNDSAHVQRTLQNITNSWPYSKHLMPKMIALLAAMKSAKDEWVNQITLIISKNKWC